MFGFLKDILGKGEKKPITPSPQASTPVAPAAPAPAKPSAPAKPAPAAPAPAAAAPAQPKPAPVQHGTVENFTLHLKPILDKLPSALRDKVAKPPAENVTAQIGIRGVAEQLQKGLVCVPFNELHKACPADTFANAPANDTTLVEIPLSVLLAKLDLKLLTRRSNQKKVEVPDDVTGLFGADIRAAASGAKPAPAPEPKPAESTPIKMSAPLPPPPAKPPAPTPPPPAPKPVESTPIKMAAPAPAPTPAPATPAPQTGEIVLKLSDVSSGWPAEALKEIPNAPTATLALSAQLIGEALKKGKISFPWKLLRTCLRPTPLNAASANDETAIELPLAVVAPVFMAATKPAGPQKKIAIDEKIPDMFSGRGPATPPPPPPAAPAPAPAPTSAAAVPVAASPAETIQGIVKLPGVSGAIIALPDGLPVAAQLPAGLKAETVAAFIPQMLNRMVQYAKEMNLGELDGLTFTVSGTPWQIFKAGNLFLAVAGRKGESLPAAQLAAVAANLAKQAK